MSDLGKLITELTPEQLELLHLRLGRKSEKPARQQIPARGREDNKFPLSYSQQRYWFLDQLDPDRASYNIPTAVRMKGVLDKGALEESLNRIVQRHETLRTNFDVVDGELVQIIAPPSALKLKLIDLRSLPADEREAEVYRLGATEAQRTFDLTHDPLLRATLLKLSNDEHVLLLVTHHIICDKWSHGLFMQELQTLYEAITTGARPSLPSLPIQYADFAAWQQEWLRDENLEKLLAYWKSKLEHAPASMPLPTDFPRQANQPFKAARHQFSVPAELTQQLKSLSQQEDATLFMTLLAGFKLLLARYTEQEQVVVSFLWANRNRPEIENIIGHFANTLLMYTELKPSQSFQDVLRRVREDTLGAYAHQDMPFEKLVEELRPERELGRVPLFEVSFNLQKAPPLKMNLPRLTLTPFEVYRGPLHLAIYLEMEERENELVGELEYNAELFEAETMGQLAAAYLQLLARCVQNPQLKLPELDLPAELSERSRAARARAQKQTIAVSATFTAEPLEDALAFWMQELQIPARLEFAPYNQVFQQLLDPESLLARNEQGVNLILVRMEDWLRFDAEEENDKGSSSTAEEKIERNVRDLLAALRASAARSNTPQLLCLCPTSPVSLAEQGRAQFYEAMETRIAEGLQDVRGVYVIRSEELLAAYPVRSYYDPYGDHLGHVPYTQPFFAALGTSIARKLYALRSKPYKVIALDCDQTLWKGVCAEDGPSGVRIDGTHLALQQFMLDQYRAGMLLCLCSKNNEADVFEVFKEHPAMPLRGEHLAAWRINWQPKSDNLKSLAEELDLGLDSFIFIDDDRVSCAEVQANCPDVLTLHHPQDEGAMENFLEHIWAFDHLRVTAEDQQRAAFYRQNQQRRDARQKSLTFADFLAELDLKINIQPLDQKHVARVAQLTERTNQFNAAPQARPEAFIQQLLRDTRPSCMVVEVRDRFGDYGLVGAMIYKEVEDALEAETFLLSCRALGRGVEHRMMQALGGEARARGLEWVQVRFQQTVRNQPAHDFLKSLASPLKASSDGAQVFRLSAEQAAMLTFQPQEKEPYRRARISGQGNALVQNEPARATQGRVNLAAQLRRIAMELSTVEQILKAIESSKRHSRSGIDEEFVAPRTPIEEMLAQLWTEVLGVDQVGVHDNFFKLGGHSVLAAMLVSKVMDTFRMEMSLRAFFEKPTLAAMAESIERYQLEQGDAQAMAAMMEELDSLSDEEVKALLADEARLAKGGE